MTSATNNTHWWQTAVIYHIYPRSFQDSNGDGVGDLRGITRRLTHLVDLGVDAFWLSPVFTSPMADFGYDVADYTDIDPVFGTLADFDALVSSAHALGLKIIVDLVPNHTSDQHPWFVESCSSRTNPKREWYIWREPAADGGPPNNWLSAFGGIAWELDQKTRQYYYHAFLAAQPDLNWRNSEVRAAIYDVMRFWLRRGVDGFRIDVIWHLVKDNQFRDNPESADFRPGDPPHHVQIPLYTADRPEVHEIIAEMRRAVGAFPDCVLIGEIYLPIERLVAYYGRDLTGLHLPFNFSLLSTRWHARSIAKLIDDYEAALPPGGWPNWVLGNHDRPRVASRLGQEQARNAAILLLTLRGTPTIYYGDEIGMEQVEIAPEKARDPCQRKAPGLGRDGCRTPMQWDDTANAGFSEAEPWLTLANSFREQNVADQLSDHTSVYHLHRRLIRLRRQRKALSAGVYTPIAATGDMLMFARALNLGGEPASVSLRSGELTGRILLSSLGDRDGESVCGNIDLRPNEGVVIEQAG
jgi:alpha-glucosidase